MEFHGRAWYEILTVHLGANLTRDQVKHQMYGRNDELLKRIFGEGRFTDEQLYSYGMEKEFVYQRMYRDHMSLIPGLGELLKALHSNGKPMAIGSAALPLNIDFILDTLRIRHYFPIIVSAEDVVNSKPDPETYLKAAQELGVDPSKCLVFEDAPKGVESAYNARMNSIVITSTHAEADFEGYPNIVGFYEDYTNPALLITCLK